ncbi:7TM GPCR domain containing protein [Trichostrongylus colubriformis]|uniref:7TM GPCR domain containing protein n=1 Tax=Trichostrongylus colubriformis TaxID=6319 RepID=A0AAN8FJ50_TRICO
MNSTKNVPDYLEILETALLGSVSIFGFLCNALSFVILIRHRVFRNSFGYLAACEALSNALTLLIFALWATPWTFMEIPSTIQWLNLYVGQLSLATATSCFHCSLIIAINRFVAVMLPALYRQVFNERVTVVLLLIILIISTLYFSLTFTGCEFYFDHDFHAWTFGEQPCSQSISLYIDTCYNLIVFVIIGSIDIVVFVRVRSARKKIMASSGGNAEAENRKRAGRENRMFMQSLLSNCAYLFMLFSFHVLARFTSAEFGLFMFTTWVWAAAHAAGGLILIYFNPEVKGHLVSVPHFVKFVWNPVTTIDTATRTTAVVPSNKY